MAEWLVPDFGSQDCGFKSCWRWTSANGCIALHLDTSITLNFQMNLCVCVCACVCLFSEKQNKTKKIYIQMYIISWHVRKKSKNNTNFISYLKFSALSFNTINTMMPIQHLPLYYVELRLTCDN